MTGATEMQAALDEVRNVSADLTRRPIELEQFFEVIDAARVRHVRAVTGHADLGSGETSRQLAQQLDVHETVTQTRSINRRGMNRPTAKSTCSPWSDLCHSGTHRYGVRSPPSRVRSERKNAADGCHVPISR